MVNVIAESLAALHTHTHTIMSTKQAVNKTALKTMFKKARKHYLTFKKLKLGSERS